jgi:hypothetical protein
VDWNWFIKEQRIALGTAIKLVVTNLLAASKEIQIGSESVDGSV